MATNDQHQETCAGAENCPCGPVLPERLANLINPTVLAARSKIVQERLASGGGDRALRRLCAEIVAQHLLKEDLREDLHEAA